MPLSRDPKTEDEKKIFSVLNEIDDLSHQYGFIAFLVGGFCREEVLGNDHKIEDDCDMMSEQYHGLYLAGLISEHYGVPLEFRHRTGTAKLNIDGVSFDFQPYMKNPRLLEEIRKLPLPQNYFTLNIFSRDFTVNTLAMSLRSGQIYDLTKKGKADLLSRTLRTPLDPNITFKEDPMLVLRAIDFVCRGFTMVPELEQAVSSFAGEISSLPRQNIDKMVNKILTHDSKKGQMLLDKYGIR
jgi:poly(A) polymerase